MTGFALAFAGIAGFLAGLALTAHRAQEAWERGREYGLAERRRVLDVRYPVVPVEDEYSVTGIGS